MAINTKISQATIFQTVRSSLIHAVNSGDISLVKWIEDYQVRSLQDLEDDIIDDESGYSSGHFSRSGFLPKSHRKLGRDLDIDLPPSLMVSGGLNEGAMGIYDWSEEEGWYKQRGTSARRNFLCRNPDNGHWSFTKSRGNVTENKGITVSYTSAHLPTRTGLRWTSRSGGEWKEDEWLHVVPIDDVVDEGF